MAKQRKRGFGGVVGEHSQQFARGLRKLEQSLNAAESYARNGDCYAMMDEAAQAFEIRGQLNAHRDSASAPSREYHARTWVALGTRLNFLRQSMKKCVG